MAPNQPPNPRRSAAYQQALKTIEACRRSGEKSLDLSETHLDELPPEIGQLANLTRLYLKQALSTMKDMASALPSGKLDVGSSRDFEHAPGTKLRKGYALEHRPELVALRHIHDLLDEQISKPKRWGDLRPVRTKSGDILWLCHEHAELQDPSPLSLQASS